MNYPTNIEEIRKFAKEIKLDVKYLLGETYNGNLDLTLVEKIKIPANVQFNVRGDLWLGGVVTLPENVTFDVGERLCLNSVETIHSSVQFVNYKILFLPFDEVKVKWT